MILPDGNVLADPSNVELMHAAGAPVDPEHIDFDLVIVGTGPAGLSAAVYGASEGFSTLAIDEGGIGGQATSSALIRNYLGFPEGISGGRLAEQAYEQAWVLGAKFAFMQRAVELRREGERIRVSLSDYEDVHARAVILSTGASYRRLGVPELEAMNGAGVFYGGSAAEAPGMAGEEAYVLGGANSAGQAALYLARFARRVTLVVRAGSLATGMSHYLAREVEANPNVDVRLGTDVVGGGGDGWLRHLTLRNVATGEEETVPAAGLFLMIGAHPHTDWLPDGREQRPARVHPHWAGSAGLGVAARAEPVRPRDEHARRVRRRRRPPRLGEARGVRGGRGLDGHPIPPRAVRNRSTGAACGPSLIVAIHGVWASGSVQGSPPKCRCS